MITTTTSNLCFTNSIIFVFWCAQLIISIHAQVTLSNAPTISTLQNREHTRMVECSHASTDLHISRGSLVRFLTTAEDIKTVSEAAEQYRGDNRGFYDAISRTGIRKYIRDPSLGTQNESIHVICISYT